MVDQALWVWGEGIVIHGAAGIQLLGIKFFLDSLVPFFSSGELFTSKFRECPSFPSRTANLGADTQEVHLSLCELKPAGRVAFLRQLGTWRRDDTVSALHLF